jgi:hypothetical protein
MACGKINNQRETINVRELGHILISLAINSKISDTKNGKKGGEKI